MEAARVMEDYSYVVMRGICDYADSYKSKGWQNYAAATLAACAKGLLIMIPAINIESSEKPSNLDSLGPSFVDRRLRVADGGGVRVARKVGWPRVL
jgi:hypothetical protein